MNPRAQAGLEYLMTYGWALILVATIITVLVFVVGGEKPGGVTFVSSDPTKIMLKAGGASGNSAGLVLQNATGGKITIKSITLSGDVGVVSGTKLNGAAWPTFPVDIIAGGEIRFDGLNASNGAANSRVTILYKDYANFDREVSATSGQGGPAGIVAGYSLEGTDGTDGSGNRNTGTVIGAVPPPAGTVCPSGQCLSFTNDYVEIPYNSSFDVSKGFTYMAWINPSSLGASHNMIMGKSLPYFSVFSYKLFLSIRVNPAECTAWGQCSHSGSASLDNPLIGKWYHAAAVYTYNPAINKGDMRVFLNGKQDGDPSPPYNPIVNTAIPLRIGDWASAPSYPFNGLIDEVRIYNRALSASEVCSECKRFAVGAGVTCGC